MQLNPEQELVAEHLHGRMLTLAGPGSGKTRTLTERTARLIRRNINPATILCLTFTNKARDEMQHRIAAACGPAAEQVFISNFHGLCGTILRHMGSPLGYAKWMTVCDSDDQVDLLMQIARMKGMEPTKPQARALAWLCNEWREALGDQEQLQVHVPKRISIAEMNVIRRYVEILRQRNQCDFSGLLAETVRLLREHPPVRERLQKKFQFIQVDEYQDTNRAQNEIVELLAGPQDNVLAVGDGDQSIYEWRGASPDGIPQFIANGEKKTGSCKIVKLGINYRSTPQIIQVADTLIRHCAKRIPVEFSTTRPPGEPAKCAGLRSPEEEAEAVAGSIHQLIGAGLAPREIAVFYRTNDMSRLIEQSLTQRHIPYLVIGSGSYYDRMEVKDVLSMLRFLCNPRDGISFARIANKPTRGMGDALIGRLETLAQEQNTDLLTALSEPCLAQLRDGNDRSLGEAALRACREVREVFGLPQAGRSVADIAHEVLQRSRYEQYLLEKYEDQELEDRRRNINELVHSIGQFCRANPRSSIGDYLQSISLYTQEEAITDGNAVRLMSLHASKGLEFDAVYILGAEQGLLPHSKAVEQRGDAGTEEERRLCYVGFTRARKVLRVSWCQQRADTAFRGRTPRFKTCLPSQFLMESGLMGSDEYHRLVEAHSRASPRIAAPSRRPAPAGMRRK